MYIGLYVKQLLFLSDLKKTRIFFIDFRKVHNCQISWQSVHWESSFYVRRGGQTDRRTDGRTDIWRR